MNVRWSASSFHGIRAIPMKQVITPPMRKLIFRGQRLEKSLAGETTLAPMLTLSVASKNCEQRNHDSDRRVEAAQQWTGSQMAVP